MQHKKTKKKFEMRLIETEGADEGFMSTFDGERQARLRVKNDKHVDELIDVFSTDSCKFMVLKQRRKAMMSLKDFVNEYFENRTNAVSGLSRLEFACSTLGSVCASLARFENQGVMHRQISRRSIKFHI